LDPAELIGLGMDAADMIGLGMDAIGLVIVVVLIAVIAR